MSGKWTPGPWRAESFNSMRNLGFYVKASAPPTLAYIAEIHQSFGAPSANAHLIAAAPELYSALEAAIEEVRIWAEGCPDDERYARTEVVIARAVAALKKARVE